MTHDTNTGPLLLRGVPGSPYTRKMLAVLRYRHIDYALLYRNSPRLAELPRPKVDLLPTFYLPNAAGVLEALTDSTPLLTRFETQFPGPRVRPAHPVLRFIDSVLEDYGDEWLTKAMFHYRWSYAPDIAKAGGILPRWRNLGATDTLAAEMGAQFSQHQINRLHFVGSNKLTAPTIEKSYLDFLDAFNTHLIAHAFLLGARPGAGDFAVYGQLTQLAHFDPTPAALTLERAARVHAWVAMADDLSGLTPRDSDWLDPAALPDTLIAILTLAGRTYVPLMLANARALKAGADKVETEIDGRPWVQNPFPYQGKCLQWLREEFAALQPDHRAAAEAILERAGCAGLVHAAL